MEIPILRLDYDDDEIEFIKNGIEQVLRSGFLTMSTRVYEFEKQFAEFCKTDYALGTNSGTSAIEIALRSIGVAGGTVVIPSNTYMATALAAIKAGAKVIFTECEKNNLQMDPDDLAKKIRSDTKAVVIVHIGGIISDKIEKIKDICDQNNIRLIEDAAHAHGAEFNGVRAGCFGEAACFSFYPTKVLTTAEGGMMVTNNEQIYQKGIVLREHGKADHDFNVHIEIGDNWRFSEIHAILGIQQMKRAELILKRRRQLARYYDFLLKDFDKLKTINIPDNIRSAYYKYIVYLPEDVSRNELKLELINKYGVSLTGEVYSDPCHNQPVFKKYPDLIANAESDVFPVTEYVSKHHACLPVYPGLSEAEIEYVVDSLKKVLS